MKTAREELSNMQPSEVRMHLKELEAKNPQEATFARIGYLRDIVERIREGNKMNDRTKGLFGSPDMELMVRAIMPNEAAVRNFARTLQVEKRMAATRAKVQGNSSTAGQLTELQEATRGADNAMAVAKMTGNALTGRFGAALTGAADLARNGYARLHGVTPAVGSELLKLGMSRDPRRLDAVLSRSAARDPDARTAVVNATVPLVTGDGSHHSHYQPRDNGRFSTEPQRNMLRP